MARITDIPVSKVAEVVGGAKDGQGRRRECVRVAVELGDGVDRGLALALKGALVPETASGLVHVGAMREGEPVRVNPDTDVALVVSADAGELARSWAAAFARAGVACALVVETAAELGEDGLPEGVGLVAASTGEAVAAKLAEWMAEACAKDIALAANFPFVRRAVAAKCVRGRSAQNAAVGLLPFDSGADLPVMAANQALMALDIAGAYGKDANLERLAEMAVVVAGALGSRGIARAACKALPGLGLVVKTGIAYAGTFAIGSALTARFELEQLTARTIPASS